MRSLTIINHSIVLPDAAAEKKNVAGCFCRNVPPGTGTNLTGAPFDSKLPPMFTFRVQNAEHDDAPAFDAIKQFVRKPASEQAAEFAVIKTLVLGVGFQSANRRANFNQQFITQTGALRFIPRPRFPLIRLPVWSEDDAPAHARNGL